MGWLFKKPPKITNISEVTDALSASFGWALLQPLDVSYFRNSTRI